MIYRLTLAVVITASMATMADAQSGTRNPLRAVPQIQPQPQVTPRQQIPLPQLQNPNQIQPQPQPQFAPQQQPMPGQGVPPQNPYYNNSRPLIGSGLIAAQKDGCNCFQLPPPNTTPEYDPYASRNYWDLCPPAGQGRPRTGCQTPKYDFNRFIPRPTRGFFRR